MAIQIIVYILLVSAVLHFFYERVVASMLRLRLNIRLIDLWGEFVAYRRKAANPNSEPITLVKEAILSTEQLYRSITPFVVSDFFVAMHVNLEAYRIVDQRSRILENLDSERLSEFYNRTLKILRDATLINCGGALPLVFPLLLIRPIGRAAVQSLTFLVSAPAFIYRLATKKSATVSLTNSPVAPRRIMGGISYFVDIMSDDFYESLQIIAATPIVVVEEIKDHPNQYIREKRASQPRISLGSYESVYHLPAKPPESHYARRHNVEINRRPLQASIFATAQDS